MMHTSTPALLITLLIWLASIVATYLVAQRKGRSVALWTLLAILISWLALIIVALLPARRKSLI
jgi:uncharacterized membrane protein YoaT (DUF817 family)